MLNFPTCPPNIPRVLWWYNPKHYAILAYWIYFRPTALKCYFQQALPELYDYKAPPGFFRRWGNPSYLNLFLMIPTVALVLSFIVGMCITSFSAWLFQVEVNWPQWQDGLGFGVAVGVAVGMAMGMVGSTLAGIATGTLMGITFGVTMGVTGGVSASVAFALEFKKFMDAGILLSAIFGMLAGMAVTLDIEIGVAVSLTFLTIGAMSFGAEFIVFRLFGTRFGALLARGMLSGAFIAGAFRVIFYPVQALLALFSFLPWIAHPLEWDELPLLPLPWTRTMLLRRLRKDETQGLQFLADVWRNLFWRPSIQVVLYRYLHKHPQPLRLLYGLLTDPKWAAYMLIPLTAQSWENNESVRRVLLGELALRPVEATHAPRFKRSGWWLNLHLYPRRQTPLTHFAGMLYDLLDPAIIEADDFALTTYERIYSGVAFYPNGKEIALSFHALAQFLSYQHVSELARAQDLVAEIGVAPEAQENLRPAMLNIIRRLGQVGGDINVYCTAADHAEQLSALARAAGALNELSDNLPDDVAAPESHILQRIIQRWQHQILTTIGELGKVEDHAERIREDQLPSPEFAPASEAEYQI